MIRVDCTQGSDEWHTLRLGVATSSNFGKIMTPVKCELSAAAGPYRLRLLSEWLMGEYESDQDYSSDVMSRGFMMQPQALAWYALQRDVTPDPVGFCFADERRLYGCSPDALIGDDGGVEIKCQLGPGHVRFLMSREVPKIYLPQVHGSMLVTGRKWWDFVSYHPNMQSAIVRVHRDEARCAKMSVVLEDFLDTMREARKTLRSLGYEPTREAQRRQDYPVTT